MPKSSLEELRGQISAGDYAVDSRELAGDLLSKFALIRKVRSLLLSQGDGAAGAGDGPAFRAPNRRRTRPGSQASARAQSAFRRNRPE